MDGGNGRAMRARLGQEHLHVAELPLLEPTLAIAQIKLPHAHEALRVTQCAHLGLPGEEALAPGLERARVMRADILHMKQLQIRGARQGVYQRLHRGNEAAGKNETLDEIDRAPGMVVELI